MPLRRPWQPLEREVLSEVPDRYGVYELGDAEGTVMRVEHGPLRDAIKEALAYDEAATHVRFTVTPTREAAEATAAEHRERLED